MTMRRILSLLAMSLATAGNSLAQDIPTHLDAIAAYLKDSHPDHASMEELWIRDGVFDVSRHDVKHSFRNPVREWTDAEKERLRWAARGVDLPLRFCREDCDEAPDSAMTVAFGEVKSVSAEQAVIPIQVDDSDENGSWQTSYEVILVRSPDGAWSVTEARPGAHSDSVSCFELYGHSCEEEREKREQGSEDGDYTGELVGALIGGVVSFYGLGILGGAGSYLHVIPGALIGMGIGSKF